MRYLEVNRANWDSRVPIHVTDYGIENLLADPAAISDVVRFDHPRLGPLNGLEVLHLQCHLGTDTLSLHRLGGQVTGLDLSPASLREARRLAEQADAEIEYVEADVYSAVDILGAGRFDLVYTGIGAICWLPSIAEWARTVAALLRRGGRLFIRDAHPVLNALLVTTVAGEHPDRTQQDRITEPGRDTLSLELPYFEQSEPLVWHDRVTYAGEGILDFSEAMEWNHGLGETTMALLGAGLQLTSLIEHDSVPWDALPGLMVCDEDAGEYRLADRPERLPASFTLTAFKP